MPYGLFDFEDTIEPMGASPQWDSEAFYNVQNKIQNSVNPFNPSGYSTTNPAQKGSFDPYGYSNKPAPTPQNTGIPATAQKLAFWGVENSPPQQVTTMAIPENSPAQSGIPATAQKLVYRGAENSPSQQVTMAIPENPPSGNPYTLAVGESGVVTDAMVGSEAPPNMTFYINPENPVTPPSGQCPTGYQPANQTSGGIKGTPNTFGFDGQGNPIPVEGGAFNYGSGLSSGSVFGSSGRTNEMPITRAGNTLTQMISAR